jgi:predicted  nucleic acid-binding Zn-ribbon protein
LAALRREVEELKSLSEQLRDEVKRGEEKIETYRSTVKTKNDQIADLKSARDEKAALLAGADARVAAGEEKAVALQTKLDAVSSILKVVLFFFFFFFCFFFLFFCYLREKGSRDQERARSSAF